MRPPSYYTSLANYNTNSGSNTNSSKQLRSSFSSSSSSSYVSRTHLPYVPQSTLVAHCFTGVGSSTKPYGHSSYSPSTSPSYLTSYSSPRAQSTKRRQASSYLSTSSLARIPSTSSSTGSTYSLPPSRSSYLSSPSPSARAASSYRPTATSYYKPIRLRERPLLTQISRQLNTATTTRLPPPSRVHSELAKEEQQQAKSEVNETGTERNKAQKDKEEESWSSDVARNISRNKYLIKFREFDKRPSVSPIQIDLEPTTAVSVALAEPEPVKNDRLREQEPTRTVEIVAVEKVKEEKMKLPNVVVPARTVELVEKSVHERQDPVEIKNVRTVESKLVDKQVDCDTTKQVNALDEKKPAVVKAPKEKRNIKLKIKTLNPVSSSEKETTTTTSEPGKVAKKSSTPKESTEQVQTSDNAIKTKVKKLVKSGKNKTTADGQKDENEEKKKSSKPPKDESGLDKTKTKLADRKVLASKQQQQQVMEKKGETAAPTEEKQSPPNTSDLDKNSADTSTSSKRIRFREYNIDDFNFLSVLGHGGWGFVILAELKEHDACFAVKCIKKITIVEDDDFDSIMIERKVLTLGNVHPFICKLFCTFETDGYLFFVMEYCAGGDLMFHVQKEGKFTESRCRFYAAEIICAIRFLHNRHIIYRDLKLDNILLDSSGHIRLVDFGMCQCRTYREEMLPSNFCGTPEYISPEIIKGVPYNHSVDWWSFGVLLYEMAVGKMPFRGSDENELLWNVCYEQIHYPMFLTKELTTLLQSLLEREPAKRMGMSTCKLGDIYDQSWFRGTDWRAMEGLRVKPPFVPEVNSKRDVQNFDADFTESAPELSPVDESTLKKIDQNQFQKFPYTNPDISIFD